MRYILHHFFHRYYIYSLLFLSITLSSIHVNAKQSSRDQQITDLKLSLEHNPNDVPVLLKLSKLLLKTQRYNEALTYLKRTKEVSGLSQSNLSKVIYYLAFAYRQTKQYPLAVESYREFIKQSTSKSNASDAYFGLGKTYEQMGDTVAALEAFETFITLEKRSSNKKYIRLAKQSIKRLKAKVVSINQKNDDEVLVLEEDQKGDAKQSTPNQSISKAKTQADQQSTSPASLKKSISSKSLSLADADQAFVQGKYEIAKSAYLNLLQTTQKNAQLIVKQQLYYQAAVSAFLAQQYDTALTLCEDALLFGPHPMLESLATLSYALKQDQPSHWSSIQLALQEARFTYVLDFIERVNTQGLNKKQKAMLSRAQGKAYMGLHRFEEAYKAFKQVNTQFSHILLDLELGQAAEASLKYKAAKKHYATMLTKLQPKENQMVSPLYVQAKQSLTRLNQGK